MNKNKVKNIFIFIIVLALCLCACSKKATTDSDSPKETSKNTNAEKIIEETKDTPVEEDMAAEDVVEEEIVEDELENSVVGVWTIDDQKFYDKNNEGQLGIAYGSGISYGYEMTFSEDGSFSYYIGITSYGKGTYEQRGNEIAVSITEADFEEYLGTYTYTLVEEDGKTYIVMKDLDYIIYWYQE